MPMNAESSAGKTFLWMVFVVAILAEHGYAGMKVHDILVEQAVTESKLEDSQKMTRMLASVASHFVPNLAEATLNVAGSKQAASQPPDAAGIFVGEAASEEEERAQRAALEVAKKANAKCKGKQCK